MYKVELVGAHNIDDIWQHVSDGLEESCIKTGGDIDAAYLWSECRSGRAYLFAIISEGVRGASVWRFEDWASGKKFRCMALYGDNFMGWKEIHEKTIRSAARYGHAQSLVTCGRVGWERVLPGAKILKQTYELELD